MKPGWNLACKFLDVTVVDKPVEHRSFLLEAKDEPSAHTEALALFQKLLDSAVEKWEEHGPFKPGPADKMPEHGPCHPYLVYVSALEIKAEPTLRAA